MSNAADPSSSKGVISTRLMSILEDSTRQLMEHGPYGIALMGSGQDAAVLGLMSLYQTVPIHSYGANDDKFAHAAAIRFGSLHQSVKTQTTDMWDTFSAMAKRDDVQLLTGSFDGPGPFSDDRVSALLEHLPENLNEKDVIQSALYGLLGRALTMQNQ